MSPAQLQNKLIEACESESLEDIKYYLSLAGGSKKEYLIQKVIENNKNYLKLLIPDFTLCQDQSLLMGVLQAAININDLDLTKKAINQGVKPELLLSSSVINLDDLEILKLLIANGFNIHADENIIFSRWMGSSEIAGWDQWKSSKDELLYFVFEFYLEKPESIEKFKTLRLPDKTRLFRMGLDRNNLNMMKFAIMIGVNKNEALNSALYRYYATHHEKNNIHSTMFKNHKSATIDYDIIEYLLKADIQYDKTSISNAVCFKYSELLNSLSDRSDLEYGYEMSYKFEDDELCEYFIKRGVSKEAQIVSQMKISAIKGDIKELRKAVNDGADLSKLDQNCFIEMIYTNKVESLQYLYDIGVVLNRSLNRYLDIAMREHQSYETITFLIETGFDITSIKKIPKEFSKRYQIMADMWEKRFSDIFEYTVYLAGELSSKIESKEKEVLLQRISELSSLPYVIQKSKEISNEQ